jgi:hypothetical protein
MRKLVFALTAAMILAPALAQAQSSKGKRRSPTHIVEIRRTNDDCCWGNRFFLEPYAGAMQDAYDHSPDDENTAYMLGFRIGYHLSSRVRLMGNLGYSQSDDVANPNGLAAYHVYDNTWVFTTAGGEFDVVPGQTSASLGLTGGAAWRRIDLDGSVGSPLTAPTAEENFTAQEVLIPSLSLRHRMTSRTTIMAGLYDNILNFFEGPAKHSLAVTAGIAFR